MLKASQVKYSPLLVGILSVSTIVILIVALVANLYRNEWNMNFFFSSDTLYLPSIYRDLFIDRSDISRWHLNPAPNYFPDMLVYFVIMFLTKDLIVAALVFGIVQYLFIGFLFTRLLRIIFPGTSAYYTLFIYTFLALFLAEVFFFTKDFLYVFYLIINSYHAGAFVMALLCLLMTLHFIRSGGDGWLILIALTSFLVVISDRLFVMLYTIPVCLTSLLLYRSLGKGLSVFIVISSVAGLYVHRLIDTDPFSFMTEPGKPADIDRILQQFAIFGEQFKAYLSSFGIMTLTIYGFILSLGLMAYLFFQARKAQHKLMAFYALFSILFSVCVICIPMIAGQYQGQDCLRYNIYPFYLSVLNFAVFLAFRLKEKEPSGKSRLALAGANILLMLAGLSQISARGLDAYFNYYPENARRLDELAEKEGLRCGVANYWEAKKITMFSKKNVKVYAVFDDLSLYQHVANDNWFFNNTFNFVVLTNFADTSFCRERLSDIRYISNTAEFKLIKTHPFTYSPYEGGRVIDLKRKDKDYDKQGS